MICPPCADAGRHTTFARKLAAENPAEADAQYFAARQHHGECKGGNWCDCQHDVTPNALNQKLLDVS